MCTMTASNPLQIVDISQETRVAAAELLDALTTQGFVFIDGHDFTQIEVDSLFNLSKQFFQLPREYKEKYIIDSSLGKNTGYISFTQENLDPSKKNDFKEGLNMSELNLLTGEPDCNGPIPDWLKNDTERYGLITSSIKKLNLLNLKLLELVAIALSVEDQNNGECKGKDWFTSRYKPTEKSGSTFRWLHYPVVNSEHPDAEIRAGAHTDYGSMTLLFQRENQEGLEIYSPMSKLWEKVPFVKSERTNSGTANAGGSAVATEEKMAPPIVMNIGDLLSYWTAGLLKSTIHRVRFENSAGKQQRNEDRYSIVFFAHPSDDTLLEPVPCDMIRYRSKMGRGVAKDEEKGEYITALQHLQKKLANTYTR
ncbi:conserved hypothetical protein [Lodderomyces elongisporus NRRL YB-4239]|uniref:Fe2OG dioxygenase domain-containing protein n=1 Tax=Lodderomyces elongisporus (strain ATCC 11503 / CBS 2605 / JCM 1781 / NBRC 1676 / NRRL YB-4239) TaxID=379508 RepID=A5E4I8_LODEL|nr:conserved hypothetical protein [Lodderomyces elongisporus NRRL YB-4239]